MSDPRSLPRLLAAAALATATAALPPALATEQEPVSASDPAWVGRWAATGDTGEVLLLEPRRCGWWREGRASFFRLRGGGEAIELESWGRLTPLGLEVVGDELHVERSGERLVFERTGEIPDGLAVKPYELPEPVELDEAVVTSIQEDLRVREAEDQRVRTTAAQAGFDDASRDEMLRVDADNTEFLLALIEELGWIDAARFGSEASMSAFLLVQHSGDYRLMRTALPFIEADLSAGRIDGQAYALLYDRLQLNLGYAQRYGSQCGTTGGGETVLMPCEDLERVDERRAELGMQPLADYLALFPVPQPVRTLEDALQNPEREG